MTRSKIRDDEFLFLLLFDCRDQTVKCKCFTRQYLLKLNRKCVIWYRRLQCQIHQIVYIKWKNLEKLYNGLTNNYNTWFPIIHVVKFLIVLHVWYFTYHSGQLEHDQEVIWHTQQSRILNVVVHLWVMKYLFFYLRGLLTRVEKAFCFNVW